jgi:hypothetical protein
MTRILRICTDPKFLGLRPVSEANPIKYPRKSVKSVSSVFHKKPQCRFYLIKTIEKV